MKVSLYYRHIDEQYRASFQALVETLHAAGIATCEVHDGDRLADCDFLLCIGGDGTLLSAIQFICADNPDAMPPIIGINFGHLGFLTTVSRSNFHTVADELLNGRYTLESRTLLQLSTLNSQLSTRFALNEVFIHRREQDSLLRTRVYVNGDYVATYAGDGVIVATPTGSTAYSLSCGGPILTPDSQCLVITPISAHTLTLRPIIVPDTARITLTVEQPAIYTLGVDSQRITLHDGGDLHLQRTPFNINLIRTGEQNFFSAIRDKLMWGTEIRHQ